MACSEFEDLILDYFDDALSAEQRSRLDAHTAACAECRRFWSVQKALDIELPAGFRQRVLSCLQTEVETTRFVYLPEVLDMVAWLSVAAAAGWYGLHYLPVSTVTTAAWLVAAVSISFGCGELLARLPAE